jgi:signal transduction histidine kinase
MRQLVEDLLAYAGLGTGQRLPESVDLRTAVGEARAALGGLVGERGAEVTVDVAPGAALVGNAVAVRSLLQNLLSNAVKFADPERPRVRVAIEADGGGWRLSVADNGPGIDPADWKRIFEPFQRLPAAAAQPGTGLGLSICRRAVERLGGEFGVESVEGQGSCFWAALPGTPPE